MEKQIEEVLQLVNESEKDKIQDFLNILSDMKLGNDKKLEGILYYCLKHGTLNEEEIKHSYEEKIYENITILSKLDKINYSQQNEEAENIRKMFFAITKDIRIIMLKIAFVVVDLRHIQNATDEEKQTLANSIFALFAPLSARLGLSTYKTELENGAFELKDKKLYDEIQAKVDSRFNKRQPIVERLTSLVETCMKDLGIKGKVYGRKKHI